MKPMSDDSPQPGWAKPLSQFLAVAAITFGITTVLFQVYDDPGIVPPPPETTDWSEDHECWSPAQEKMIRETADGVPPQFWTAGQLIAKTKELVSKLRLMVRSAKENPDNWDHYWSVTDEKRAEADRNLEITLKSLEGSYSKIVELDPISNRRDIRIQSELISHHLRGVDRVLEEHGVVWGDLQ